MSEVMKERKEKLFAKAKNGYDVISEQDKAAMEAYCRLYRDFLDSGKTERECALRTMQLAEERGFVPYRRGMELKAGDKVYTVNRGKSVMLAVIGKKSLSEGAHIVAAHIDAPRLDMKPTPLYEDSELAYFKTHYYGGIRKYQWVTIPLELRGVVALRDGTVVHVALGEGDEPKFVINDLLPHLGAEQSKKPLGEAIPGESLNILLGSEPVGESGESERVKLHVLEKLHEKYGIIEDDFASAELEAVPAAMSTDIGLDASMIGAYGHDDRVCGYAGLQAIFDIDVPEHTAVCMLADKEEIGSMGVTGMQSAAFDTFIHDLCDSQNVLLRECYENSFCLSADVTAAYDPNFAEVYEKRNSARINYGIGLCKYTGARGKSGASDAGAETVAFVRRVLDDAGVIWQIAELGKVDAGGGGTVAQYMANRNIATLDAGVPVLSMHAPFETVSKLDCYMTYLGCKAIYEA
ncbi:MAG: aminopeptidase [Ruminococcaceae bacterium]|nr:aminopeptidase [Oscillospiraceae bacterium]